MQKIITSARFAVYTILSVTAILAGAFVFMTTHVAYANHDYSYADGDYGYGGGISYDSGCCGSLDSYSYSNNDYGYGAGDSYTYSYTPISYSNNDYGYGAGDSYTYSYIPISYSNNDYGNGAGNAYTYTYTPPSYADGDYGYGAGDAYTYSYTPISYSNNDYGNGAGNAYTYTYTPPSYADGDYGYGVGDATENICCDDDVDYGYGVGDATENICCDYTVDPIETESGGVIYEYETPTYTPQPTPSAPPTSLYTYAYAPTYYPPRTYGGSYSYTPTRYEYTRPVRHDSPRRDDEPRCTLTASDTRVEDGDRVTLTWSTSDADDVDINQGIGDVAFQGSEVVTVTRDVTYTLVARNDDGIDTCRITIEVEEKDEPRDRDRDVRCDAFTASDRRVEKGDRVTLEWRTTGARDVEINQGIGDVSDDGERRVTIDRDTTFTLTARDGSDRDTCRVTVEVEDKKRDRDNNTPAPRCELTISDRSVKSGEKVTLSWDNERADRIVIRDNHGNKILDSRDDSKIKEKKDAITVKPVVDTSYTLTVYNDDKTKTCTVSADVSDVVTPKPTQGISLSQVPYTGFDAGPTLTFIFYAALVIWGAFVGYLLVFRKKAGVVAQTMPVPTSMVQTTQSTAETQSNTSDVITPVNLPTEVQMFSEPTDTMVTDDSLRALEEHANAQSALISSDALRFIQAQGGTTEEHIGTLNRVIALAKARYPKEGDWVVINKEKVVALLS